MALKAEVTAVNPGSEGQVIVDVRLYDDAAPSVTLKTHAFDFAVSLTPLQMRNLIIAKAQQWQAAADKKAGDLEQFVGTVIDIV